MYIYTTIRIKRTIVIEIEKRILRIIMFHARIRRKNYIDETIKKTQIRQWNNNNQKKILYSNFEVFLRGHDVKLNNGEHLFHSIVVQDILFRSRYQYICKQEEKTKWPCDFVDHNDLYFNNGNFGFKSRIELLNDFLHK